MEAYIFDPDSQFQQDVSKQGDKNLGGSPMLKKTFLVGVLVLAIAGMTLEEAAAL